MKEIIDSDYREEIVGGQQKDNYLTIFLGFLLGLFVSGLGYFAGVYISFYYVFYLSVHNLFVDYFVAFSRAILPLIMVFVSFKIFKNKTNLKTGLLISFIFGIVLFVIISVSVVYSLQDTHYYQKAMDEMNPIYCGKIRLASANYKVGCYEDVKLKKRDVDLQKAIDTKNYNYCNNFKEEWRRLSCRSDIDSGKIRVLECAGSDSCRKWVSTSDYYKNG